MDVFTRRPCSRCRARAPRQSASGHQAGHAGAGGRERNFVVNHRPGQQVRHAGPEAAGGGRAPHEVARGPAVADRGIQTLKKDLATRVARRGGQWGDHFEQAAGAYNARPHETAHGAPEDVEKQPDTEFRLLQDNADKFRHNKDLTDRRISLQGAHQRCAQLQPAVRRRAAAAGRGLHDRQEHQGPGDPAEAGPAGG